MYILYEQALLQMTGKSKLPSPRQAQLVKLINPASKEVLDHALSLWFPGRKLKCILFIFHDIQQTTLNSEDTKCEFLLFQKAANWLFLVR